MINIKINSKLKKFDPVSTFNGFKSLQKIPFIQRCIQLPLLWLKEVEIFVWKETMYITETSASHPQESMWKSKILSLKQSLVNGIWECWLPRKNYIDLYSQNHESKSGMTVAIHIEKILSRQEKNNIIFSKDDLSNKMPS